MTKTVVACADFIKKPETIQRFGKLLKFFAIKFYGECWAQDESAASTYYNRGKDNGCYENTGDHDTVYVYHFGPSGTFLLIPSSLHDIISHIVFKKKFILAIFYQYPSFPTEYDTL